MDEEPHRDGLPNGTEVGDYLIEAAIGQGGYGLVYRARHRYLGTVVALKEYLPATVAVRTEGIVCPRNPSVAADYEDGLRRFMDEARHLVQFRSDPGVVTCLGLFEERGTAYMTMEYEEGLPLSELLTKREAAGRPVDERELLRLAEQILESLAVVHQATVLHRDIKPSNILIRRSDERPMLIDFGAAKEDFVRYTKSSAPHTQGYAAIEQMEADGKLGPWTDLYGLGAVLWRIVAGGHSTNQSLVPVDALSRMAARFRGQEDPLPSARNLGAGRYSVEVLEAIDKCLELEPRDRPADCGELSRLLSLPVGKDLVEGGHANARKDEARRDKRGSEGRAGPVPEFAVERGNSVQRLARILVAAVTLMSALCLAGLGLVGLFWQGGGGDSPKHDAQDGGVQESIVTAPEADMAASRLTEETDPPRTGRNLSTQANEERRRPGRNLLVPDFGSLGDAWDRPTSRDLSSQEIQTTGIDHLRGQVADLGPDISQGPRVQPPSNNISRNRASRLQKRDSAGVAATYFTRGSHRDDVLRLQGTPSSINEYSDHEVWQYGFSTVEISTRDGRVREWADLSGNLKVRLDPGPNVTGATTFTRGSHRDDVLRLQGTPSSINEYSDHEVWQYGFSTVEISTRDGRVREWADLSGNLKVRLDPGPNVTGATTFTRGSHRDDVLRLQGTPSSINEYSDHEVWQYGFSTVEISTRDGRVREWADLSGNLKVRLDPGPNVTSATTFTRGSHRDDVLRLQGTPSSINEYSDHEVWQYGFSTVEISTRDGRVREWANLSGNLKVR